MIVNDDEAAHTVIVTVKKMSQRESNVPTFSYKESPRTPTEEPLCRETHPFDAPGGQELN